MAKTVHLYDISYNPAENTTFSDLPVSFFATLSESMGGNCIYSLKDEAGSITYYQNSTPLDCTNYNTIPKIIDLPSGVSSYKLFVNQVGVGEYESSAFNLTYGEIGGSGGAIFSIPVNMASDVATNATAQLTDAGTLLLIACLLALTSLFGFSQYKSKGRKKNKK